MRVNEQVNSVCASEYVNSMCVNSISKCMYMHLIFNVSIGLHHWTGSSIHPSKVGSFSYHFQLASLCVCGGRGDLMWL